MSGPFGATPWMYDHTDFYPLDINQSLKFNDDESQYLTRTPASAGNRKTWTFSAWIKRGNLGINTRILGTSYTSSSEFYLRFKSDNTLEYGSYEGGGASNNFQVITTQVFRDVSAWYHIVFRWDTTQSTAANRLRIYVNGEQITAFSTANYPSQNYDGIWNNTVNEHRIGYGSSSGPFDGYFSNIHFIDGQTLTPTNFGEFKESIWIPKVYNGTYGSNGFYLPFNNNTNDASGNSNDWTANNISAHDYVPDSPTNNFAVMNPLDKDATWTLSEGNLKVSLLGVAGDNENIASTMVIPNSKLIYFEAKPNATLYGAVGVGKLGFAELNPYGVSGSTLLYLGGGGNAKIYVDASIVFDTGATWSLDILGVAVDMANSKVWFSKNGTYLGSGTQDPETNTGGFSISSDEVMPYAFKGNSNVTQSFTFNFGQDSTFAGATTAGGNTDANGIGDFKYAVPSGFLSLASSNLPTPTIVDGSDYFNTVLYTGDGSTRSITGVGFQPDFTWFKARSSAIGHLLYDNVRGATIYLQSASTSAEGTGSDSQTSFDSDGFSVGADTSTTGVNQNSTTYVAWNWLAGGAAVSNTDGSITSQVSANTAAGFSIVSYTGTGSNATVGHGLGVAPSMVIVKNRSGVYSWLVYHKNMAASNPATFYMSLNQTSAASSGANVWINDPTSTVFTVSGSYPEVNSGSNNYIAYCFANTEGYLKAGSYTGNGSADGTFVYTGFRPAWVMIKKSSAAGTSWYLLDNKRDIDNVVENRLIAESANDEGVGLDKVDFLSNGFKLRANGSTTNHAATYIYLAFAENPFKYSNAR